MNEKYGLEQVSVRMIREAPLFSDEKIQNPQDAIRILGDVFKDYDREVVGVVHLRSDNVPINMTIVSMGCLNQSLVHPREMLKVAFFSNASSIMMFHNHPMYMIFIYMGRKNIFMLVFKFRIRNLSCYFMSNMRVRNLTWLKGNNHMLPTESVLMILWALYFMLQADGHF